MGYIIINIFNVNNICKIINNNNKISNNITVILLVICNSLLRRRGDARGLDKGKKRKISFHNCKHENRLVFFWKEKYHPLQAKLHHFFCPTWSSGSTIFIITGVELSTWGPKDRKIELKTASTKKWYQKHNLYFFEKKI